MKTTDLDTFKELEAAEEEASMEDKIRKDFKTTKRPLICLKESAAAVEEEEEAIEVKKFCTGCKTTKTPLWRVGPSGPKSLCNACGIRYRKKKKTTPPPLPASSCGSESPEETDDKLPRCLSKSVKMSLVILRKDWLLESTNVGKKQRRQRKRKLREEEIAAASLVALSCGSVFA